MRDSKHDTQDPAEQLAKLRKALCDAKLDPIHTDKLHEHFRCISEIKALRTLLPGTDPKRSRKAADKINQLSDELGRRLRFTEIGGTQSPVVWEMLESAFMQHVLAQGGDLSSEHGWAPIGKSKVQWGLWRSRLSADLMLLKKLSTNVHQELAHERASVPKFSVRDKEALILQVNQTLTAIRPPGRIAGSWPELIAEVLSIYETDLTVSLDSIMGVLKKHKIKIKSR
ncbi:hypothetical protein [Paenacidovorax monticola]|uniref:Uncharacterized protein n=1 Tax=Paenacidovorax monticola TaxID=1926868 RepID=A0A7H0HKS3_9BURK|nr:hypothetical protein [Paenacidovorax monticola]QNP61139.1 hypothetical protein H9L24_10685 [Paenacidovorax monticola]